MKSVDPASVAHLNGIFAPIQDEIDVGPLEVVQGAVPRELTGVYLRNGPNCRFPPLGSYTYPLDGDGMLHAIELAGGQARYRNRYVRTPGLEAEERAGRALWGGLLTPVFRLAPSWLGNLKICRTSALSVMPGSISPWQRAPGRSESLAI